MTLNEFLKARGSAADLSERINVPQALISQWKKGIRRPSVTHCALIEKGTDGEVRCEELRPDLNWALIRNTQPEKD